MVGKLYTLTLRDRVRGEYDDLNLACDELFYHVIRGAGSGTVCRGSERLLSVQATLEYYAEADQPKVPQIAYRETRDYALIIKTDHVLHGLRVEILCDAPTTVYRLPDGGLHAASEPNVKVVRVLDGDVVVPLADGGTVRTRYAAVPSAFLDKEEL